MAKYAEICLVANDVLKNPTLTATGVANLTAAFATLANNQQNPTLCYDTTWKGLISTAGLATATSPAVTLVLISEIHGIMTIIFTTAIWSMPPRYSGISILHGSLLQMSIISTLWSEMSQTQAAQDPYFPVFRMFDWFVGHSWAEGLFFSGDGKNEESSSEDYNFSYGMKLWGLVTNNASMQGCGDLMLAVQRRYYLSKIPLISEL